MKKWVKGLLSLALAMSAGISLAATPLAVWKDFEGLTSDSALKPHYAMVSNGLDGREFTFNLSGGSVSDGVLTTGSGTAPYISFGLDRLNVGYNNNVLTVLIKIQVPVTSVDGAPFVYLGGGSTGFGLASTDSDKVCGAWANTHWNKDATYGTISSLASSETKTIYLAICPRSAGFSYAEVSSDDTSFTWSVLASGLRSDSLNATQINFGNYIGADAGGLSYQLSGVSVLHGAATLEDIQKAIGLMDGTLNVIDSDTTVDASSDSMGSIYIPEGVTVTVTDSTKITGETVISGAGKIVYDGFVPSNKAGLTSSFWTGTVGLNAAFGNNHDFSQYGNSNSTIHFMEGAAANYLAQAKTIPSAFILDGVINHNNGWSSYGGQLFSGKFSGSGTLNATGAPSDVIQITGDVSEFFGSLSVGSSGQGGHCISIGAQTDDDSQKGRIVISKAATIASEKTWSADNGVLVRSSGIIAGAGEVSSALIIEDGATIDAANGTLTVSGDLTLPAELKVLFSADSLPTSTEAKAVLKKTYTVESEEGEDVIRTTEVLVNGGTGYYLVKKSDGLYVKEKTALTSINVSTEVNTSISAVIDAATQKIPEGSTLTINFSAENPIFTFDNTSMLALGAVVVTSDGEDVTGTITMSEGALTYSSLILTDVTVSADAAFYAGNSGAISGNGKLALASGELTLDETNTYSRGTDIASGAVLIANTDSIGTGPVSGAGTLKVNGYPNEDVRNSLSDSSAWSGRLVITGDHPARDNADWLGASGNENSQIEFTGTITGYFKQAGSCDADLVLTGTINNNDGWENNGGYSFNGNLIGVGTFSASGDIGDVIKFLGETKDFAGTITVAGNRCISFGDQADSDTTRGQLVVQTNHVANIALGKTWSAANGVVVNGTIGGAGTISSALTLNAGAMLDVSSGAVLQVNGAVTLAGRVNVLIPGNADVGTPIFKYSTEASPSLDITRFKADRYMMISETVNGVTTVKLGPKTGFMIIVR